MIPPITTVANGRCTSLPMPVLNAMGTNPSAATNAVMSTGRNRVNAPREMASCVETPASHSWRMKLTMTRPFRTATPERAMKPTPAEIDNGMSRSHRASTPPVRARGMPEKMIAASRADPSAKNSRPAMMSSVTGTTTARRFDADCSCSKVPPYSSQ